MASLAELLVELLLLILQELLQIQEPGNFGKCLMRNDLAQLCFTSRLFLPTAQKLLYSCFWSDSDQETWRIRAFLRTITTNPSLASQVKTLSLYS